MASGYLQLIAFNAHSSFENGDILSVCNHLTRRRGASERICKARVGNRQFAGLNGNGFLPHDHVQKDWHEACCQFRIERLNRTQAKMTRLSDMEELIITSGVPHTDLKGKLDRVMHVEEYFKRQLTTFNKQNAQGKAIFSDDGDSNKIVMYGGNTDTSAAAQDIVWTAITAKTGKLEANELEYDNDRPFGSYMRRRLVLRVDDFTDEESGGIVEALLDITDPENPITLKKRKNFVDWEGKLSLSGATIDSIKDDKQDPDLRQIELVRGTIISVKVS